MLDVGRCGRQRRATALHAGEGSKASATSRRGRRDRTKPFTWNGLHAPGDAVKGRDGRSLKRTKVSYCPLMYDGIVRIARFATSRPSRRARRHSRGADGLARSTDICVHVESNYRQLCRNVSGYSSETLTKAA
jgi:hypothetical protein